MGQWKARGLHRPEENPPQAYQEGQQAEAEETEVPHSDGRAQRYPGRPGLPSRPTLSIRPAHSPASTRNLLERRSPSSSLSLTCKLCSLFLGINLSVKSS